MTFGSDNFTNSSKFRSCDDDLRLPKLLKRDRVEEEATIYLRL